MTRSLGELFPAHGLCSCYAQNLDARSQRRSQAVGSLARQFACYELSGKTPYARRKFPKSRGQDLTPGVELGVKG